MMYQEEIDYNNRQEGAKQDTGNNSMTQYLSFRFYKENLDHLSDMTLDSINNFLKTISEIEEEFLNMLQSSQRMKKAEFHDFGFNGEISYMEENY